VSAAPDNANLVSVARLEMRKTASRRDALAQKKSKTEKDCFNEVALCSQKTALHSCSLLFCASRREHAFFFLFSFLSVFALPATGFPASGVVKR